MIPLFPSTLISAHWVVTCDVLPKLRYLAKNQHHCAVTLLIPSSAHEWSALIIVSFAFDALYTDQQRRAGKEGAVAARADIRRARGLAAEERSGWGVSGSLRASSGTPVTA